jgi:TorA maturation chaperone TorD
MTQESTAVDSSSSSCERDAEDQADGGTEPEPGDAEPTPDELTTEAATAAILQVLGPLYLEPPTGKRLERLATWAGDWLAELGDEPDEIAGPLRRIRGARDADPEQLRAEFTRLFRGISESRSPRPPYESLYRDGQLYSSATTEVRRGYRAAGLDVADADENEPPDHLGIELQFLGALCEYGADPEGGELPPERARDAQEWFLDRHLLTWVEGFRGRMLQADPPAFYHAVLDLTVETLQAHRVALHRGREG